MAVRGRQEGNTRIRSRPHLRAHSPRVRCLCASDLWWHELEWVRHGVERSLGPASDAWERGTGSVGRRGGGRVRLLLSPPSVVCSSLSVFLLPLTRVAPFVSRASRWCHSAAGQFGAQRAELLSRSGASRRVAVEATRSLRRRRRDGTDTLVRRRVNRDDRTHDTDVGGAADRVDRSLLRCAMWTRAVGAAAAALLPPPASSQARRAAQRYEGKHDQKGLNK